MRWWIVALLAMGPAFAWAQEPPKKPAPTRPATPSQKSTKQAPQPAVSPACAEIYKSIKADTPIKEVFGAIRDAKLVKDEFETTPQYEARKASVLKTLLPLLKEASGVPLVVATQDLPEPLINYDADARQLKLHQLISNNFNLNSLNDKLSELSGWKRATEALVGTYVATNAYGVSMTVTKSIRDVHGLAAPYPGPPHGLGFPPAWIMAAPSVTIPADVERARVLKTKLAVRLAGELVSPFIFEEGYTTTPSISLPYETRTTHQLIVIVPKCVAIVDKETGEVLRPLL